jgi:hypothetical protein
MLKIVSLASRVSEPCWFRFALTYACMENRSGCPIFVSTNFHKILAFEEKNYTIFFRITDESRKSENVVRGLPRTD